MDGYESSASDSDYANSWISWFLGCKGNEYFCELDEEYITDRFNLTFLNNEVQHFNEALDLITDALGKTPSVCILTSSIDHNIHSEVRDVIEKAGSHLYGLLHARYILSQRGLLKMVLILIALPC
jgi:casein kinase II subunit beta